MSVLATKFDLPITRLMDSIKEKTADGLQIEDVYSFLVQGIGDITFLANEMPGITEEEIKELAAFVAQKLYDEVLKPLDLPFVPDWLEPGVDEAAGALLKPVVSGLVGGLLVLIKRHKISVAL